MQNQQYIVQCILCKSGLPYGGHRYEGRYVCAWQVSICNGCEQANADGIVPGSHADLLGQLEKLGVDVRLNERGWIDIPPKGE